MKMPFAFNLLVGAAVNLAFQLADMRSLPGKPFDLIELSTCTGLAALAGLLPQILNEAVRTLLADRPVTVGNRK